MRLVLWHFCGLCVRERRLTVFIVRNSGAKDKPGLGVSLTKGYAGVAGFASVEFMGFGPESLASGPGRAGGKYHVLLKTN